MTTYQKFNKLAQEVTDEIIFQLEQGKVIWKKPWTAYGLPKNYHSGRQYEGFNAFYLNYITAKYHFTAPYFLTFKQAQEVGGHVRKGEHGTQVIYWKLETKAGESRVEQPEEEKDGSGKRFIPFLWTVFNIDQVEGIDVVLPAPLERSPQQIIEACQVVVDNYPVPRPHILHGGAQAYYAPVSDTVQLPELKSFVSSQAYHATLFHELIHSTGHPDRLNRFPKAKKERFGDAIYCQEELIAEMGASFLNAFTGIQEEVFENSVAYLQSWTSQFRDDKTMIISAAAKAFKAASYLLDLAAETNKDSLSRMAVAA